jgi:imidazolonepropionase
MTRCDRLLLNANVLDKMGVQKLNYTIAINQGEIVWIGPSQELPSDMDNSAQIKEDCTNRLITPTLIDCHTHLVYSGNRANEYEQKLKGVTYAEITRRGGGTLSTVMQTRKAGEQQLIEESLPRLLALRNQGVRTIEIKSGYGLDLDTEIKILKVAKQLGQITNTRIITTFLGAHALPPEFEGRKDSYIDYLCDEMLPSIREQGLADHVDLFCESMAFSIKQTEKFFEKASSLGFPIKCHAEQLSNTGACALAARWKALSCDHLEHLDASGAVAMAQSNSTAVLLPGAYYFLQELRKPPINILREAGVGMAIATDCNPGTSPTTSLLLMLNMACQFFSLSVPEAVNGVTYQAAKALGLQEEEGLLAPGRKANLIRWATCESSHLCYYFGFPMALEVMIEGKWEC